MDIYQGWSTESLPLHNFPRGLWEIAIVSFRMASGGKRKQRVHDSITMESISKRSVHDLME